MKLSSYKKKREVFECESNGAVFMLLPLPSDLMIIANMYIFNGGKELLSKPQRIRFISECIVGWSGLEDDDDKDIEFNNTVKMQLIGDEYEKLITDLISAAFMHKNEALAQLKEDAENAKK